METYGFLSVLPPLLAIVLSVITKNVLISLFLGLFLGTTILANWNPFNGYFIFLKDFIFQQVTDSYNAQSLVMMLIIGAFVALITRSGASIAFSKKVSRWVNSKAKAETAAFLGGLIIWFSDSANAMLVGPIVQPVCDRMKVSREKLAWALDATASPICSLIPIISWGVYIMGIIAKQFQEMNYTGMTDWQAFIGMIPFQFYAWLALALCGLTCITRWDFGPMLRAELRADTGSLLRDGAKPLRSDKQIEIPEGAEPRVRTMVLAILTLFAVMFFIFIRQGFPFQPLRGPIIRVGIGYGFSAAAFVCIALSIKDKIMTFEKALETILEGMSGMVYMMVVMVFAWSLGSLCGKLGTAKYIVDVTKGFLHPAVVPVVLFFVACAMSLATGSSWGPYAILLPIGIPMSLHLGSPMLVTIASIISGGLFGDHCSPLSDTTILASMGAACDHIDHFRTQFPYALLAAAVSAVLFAIAGFVQVQWLFVVGIAAIVVIQFVIHKWDTARLAGEVGAGASTDH